MFKFRLEKVLQHRQRHVDACARSVVEAEQVLRQAEVALDEARRAIRCHDAAAAEARQGAVNAGGLQQQLTWRDQLLAGQMSREDSRDEAVAALAAAQKTLQEAWRDREVLERLRAKQYEEWKHEQARRHQQELDEVGSIRAAIGAAGNPWPQAVGDTITAEER